MKGINAIFAVLAASLCCISCCEFITDDNVLFQYPWQLNQVITYNQAGIQTGLTEYPAETEILEFSNLGVWTYSSESRFSYQNGAWATEVIPSKGNSFTLTLTGYGPSHLFIEEEHSGEDYKTSISDDGSEMYILHKHTDSVEFQVYCFSQVTHPLELTVK